MKELSSRADRAGAYTAPTGVPYFLTNQPLTRGASNVPAQTSSISQVLMDESEWVGLLGNRLFVFPDKNNWLNPLMVLTFVLPPHPPRNQHKGQEVLQLPPSLQRRPCAKYGRARSWTHLVPRGPQNHGSSPAAAFRLPDIGRR